MASNELPKKQDKLFALAEDMADGLHDHEVAVGIKQNLEATFRPTMVAAQAAESTFGTTGTAKKAAAATLKNADKAGRTFISNSRRRLAKFFGENYSAEWAAAGWPNGSTAVPNTQDERFSLLNSLKLHFHDHAAHESVDMEVTEALALAAHTAVSNARTGVTNAIAACGQKKALRDIAVGELRRAMTGLIAELEQRLSPEDPLWHAFGLNRPADPSTPETPQGLLLTAGIATQVLADWEDALRAERYRVWILIVGTDTDFHAVATVYDSDATLPDLPTGATVKVRVTSANDAGESAPGAEVEIVVP